MAAGWRRHASTIARALLDLDLRPLAEGKSLGLTSTTEPVFLVCTHGRHDICCAEKGRPIAAALAVHEPASTWEVSHIGGDRFAGNLLVLPEGLYYGRLDAANVASVAAAHRAGQLMLPLLRGRSSQPFDVQAADWYLRGKLRRGGMRDLALVSRRHEDDLTWVDFDVLEAGRWRVLVRGKHAAPATLTCSSGTESAAPFYELVEAAPVVPTH